MRLNKKNSTKSIISYLLESKDGLVAQWMNDGERKNGPFVKKIEKLEDNFYYSMLFFARDIKEWIHYRPKEMIEISLAEHLIKNNNEKVIFD